MKIIFIISSLGSGGAERVLTLIANYLSTKYYIYIITFSNEDSFYKLNKNIKHIKLNLLKESGNKFESLINTIKRVFILQKALKKVNANINISFMTHTNILSIIASKLNRQKIIISERIAYDFYNAKVLNFIRRFIYMLSNALIIQTKNDKKNYDFLKNTNVICNPINIKNKKIDLNKKEKIILAVGRLNKQKGFDILIKAFSKVNTTNWRLCIAGEGVEQCNLLKIINKLHLTNVELIGKKKDIFKWYEKSSIFVLSSKKEGFPNVLIEAMAYGCAVISFDCQYGPREIIVDGINGILIENQNNNKLSLEMQKLIDDKALRDQLSDEAIKVREKYNIEKIVNKWEDIIVRVLKND